MVALNDRRGQASDDAHAVRMTVESAGTKRVSGLVAACLLSLLATTSNACKAGTLRGPTLVDPDPLPRSYQAHLLHSLSNVQEPPPAFGEAEALVGSSVYTLTVDRSDQVIQMAMGDDSLSGRQAGPVEADLASSFAQVPWDTKFVPAAALGLKAKQFDDGLMAAVDMAMDQGLGNIPGKTSFVMQLFSQLSGAAQEDSPDARAASLLAAALKLRGVPANAAQHILASSERLQKEFLDAPQRSTPFGYYTWNQPLLGVFWRDRILQTELSSGDAQALARALSSSQDLSSKYGSLLDLSSRLTNPGAYPDLRAAMTPFDPTLAPKSQPAVSLFPPSRSRESDLSVSLFAHRRVPEGFDLAEEIIRRIRTAALDLRPTPQSGWYDHQTFALEPLVVPERMPESQHLRLDQAYRKELLGLFKALLSLTRETHIRQAWTPGVATSAAERVTLPLHPDLVVEPVPTYYLRRAQSYQFIRKVLEEAFGSEALVRLRRETASGPINLDLAKELRLMEGLFYGAYFEACREIGLPPEVNPVDSPTADHSRAVFRLWAKTVQSDPDLGTDVRMMVPVFHDIGRNKTKVWLLLGIASKPLKVWFDHPPRVTKVTIPEGEVEPGTWRMSFRGETHPLPYLVTAETYVTQLMTRAEFRRHCDKHVTMSNILANLL